MQKLKVLIVGASSFIGKNLVEAAPESWEVIATFNSDSSFPAFAKRKDNVMPFNLDVSDAGSLDAFARKIPEVDVILYLAANSDPKKSMETPALDLKVNVLGLVLLLERVRCRRLVYISSGAVRLGSLVPYLIAKGTAEQYVKFFSDKDGFAYVILRPFETFGPYSPERKIFRKLVQQFDSGKPEFTIYGDPSNLIDPLYIEDTVRALITVIESEKGNVTVDLCTGKPVAVKELVERVGKVYGINPRISVLDSRAPVNVHFVSDAKPMEEVFGFRASISLEDGIKKWQQFKKRNSNRY